MRSSKTRRKRRGRRVRYFMLRPDEEDWIELDAAAFARLGRQFVMAMAAGTTARWDGWCFAVVDPRNRPTEG